MKRISILLLYLCFGSLLTSDIVAQSQERQPIITLLSINGTALYAQGGWSQPQNLSVGTFLYLGDFIYPQASSILIMCPDGRLYELTSEVLAPNTPIQCPADISEYIIGDLGEHSINIVRGGVQDPLVPYVISPRASIVREANGLPIRWNALLNVLTYELILRGNSAVLWESDELKPEDVLSGSTGGIASYFANITLQENIAYTLEICVLFQDLHRSCTTDAGWSESGDTAFYYAPLTILSVRARDIAEGIYANSPQSLYAQAVLFAQPVPTYQNESLGAYNDSVDLLHTLLENFPHSELAQSAEFYNFLGDLYIKLKLPRSAFQAFSQARALASNCGPEAAAASLGQATTTTANNTLDLYDEALDHYYSFLQADSFTHEFTLVCQMMGNFCLQLDNSDRSDQCNSH